MMEFTQVVFKETFDDEYVSPSCGIACYKNDNLEYIICACCGGVLEPDEVEIVEEYANWIDFTDTIKGDD